MADDNEDLAEEIAEEIAEALEESASKRSPVKLEWLISAGTALSMIVTGVYALTTAEARINTRLTTIETTSEADEKAAARRISDYDARIAELENETEDLNNELNIRREYQRHVHAHICSLLAKAHGPKSAATEALCSLPAPEFRK